MSVSFPPKQETADRELDLQRAMQDSQRLAERLQRFENEHDMTVAMKQEMASVQAHLRVRDEWKFFFHFAWWFSEVDF